MEKITNTQRTVVKNLINNVGLVALFAFAAGATERGNSAVKAGIKELGGPAGFAAVATDVLRSQVSNNRGRPALEEAPIHAILKGLRMASKAFTDNEGDVTKATERFNKELAKGVKAAEKHMATLERRRALFKPSKRIQGTKGLLPELQKAPEPKGEAAA